MRFYLMNKGFLENPYHLNICVQRMFRSHFFFIFLAIISFSVTAFADEEFDAGVALRQITQYQRWPGIYHKLDSEYDRDIGSAQLLSRFWMMKKSGDSCLKFEFENNCLHQSVPFDNSLAGGSITAWNNQSQQNNRLEFWNLSRENISRRQTSVTTSIERFDYAWSWNNLDFDLGRQPISLGTSHFIGVLDILSPFYPGYLDSSYKPGIDAFRIRSGLGDTGEAELIAVPGREDNRKALLGRMRKNFDGIDAEMIFGNFRDRKFLGFGYEGEKHRVTYWGEIGLFESKFPERKSISKYSVSWIFGLEKDIRPRFRLGAAFFHQDFGAGRSEDITQVTSYAPFREGWAFLTGRNYGLITAHKEFNPLLKAEISAIINLQDRSSLWQPKLSISTGDNTDITFFSWISDGKQPYLSTYSLSTPSEFGMFPDGFGVIMRYFL
ncbi:MAG: hypothetical protein HQM10_17195 [Candidatus Riflebacteria bacterium]|nr:hypothetical protein [Candidatus Riflebacteria bacterium]